GAAARSGASSAAAGAAARGTARGRGCPSPLWSSRGRRAAGRGTKERTRDKGPTRTTYISIPGRYLVLMPSMARTGVSRKIEDEKERRRLKRLLEGLDVPPGMGGIVRTAGV